MRTGDLLTSGATVGGRFRIGARLADLSTGVLYEAQDQHTGANCCIEAVDPTSLRQGALASFGSVMAARSAVGPHLATTVATGVDPHSGMPFVAFEELNGADLGSIISQSGPMPAAQVAGWLQQAGQALASAKNSGIAHGALDPTQFFVVRGANGTPTLKLLGLGLGALLDPSRPPDRLLPFSMGAETGETADIYAIGHIAYALLVGHPFWQLELSSASPAQLGPLSQRPLPELASARAARTGIMLPPTFDRWLEISLTPEPARRFSTVTDQVDALALALGVRVDSRGQGHQRFDLQSDVALDATMPAEAAPPLPQHDFSVAIESAASDSDIHEPATLLRAPQPSHPHAETFGNTLQSPLNAQHYAAPVAEIVHERAAETVRPAPPSLSRWIFAAVLLVVLITAAAIVMVSRL